MSTKIDTSYLIPEEIAGLGKRYVKKWQALDENRQAMATWEYILQTMAMSCFKWEGLPDEIDPRFIEYVLLWGGIGGMFELANGGLAFAPATPIGKLTMYMNPNKIQLYPMNGGTPWYRHAYYFVKSLASGNVMVPADSCVCFDNESRISLIPILREYARRLANIDRKVDININAQATPYLIIAEEESRKDAINLYKQLGGNEPLIIANKGIAGALSASVFSTEAPYVADKLLSDQQKIINQVYTLLGVDNSNTEKRERMIDAEATSNNEQIMLMRLSRLAPRRRFADQVNNMFGTDITVTWAVPHLTEGLAEEGATDNELDYLDPDDVRTEAD